jgi:hypothetical protein
MNDMSNATMTADEKMAARFTVRVSVNPTGSTTATLEKKGCASREATAGTRDGAIAGALAYVANRLRSMIRVVDGADPVAPAVISKTDRRAIDRAAKCGGVTCRRVLCPVCDPKWGHR